MFAPVIRPYVARPMTRSNARTIVVTMRNWSVNPIPWASSARATKDIERKVRNIPARVNASL